MAALSSVCHAFDAAERLPEKPGASLRCRNPFPDLPWRVVTHVLAVTALELGDPVVFVVLVKAGDLSWDCRLFFLHWHKVSRGGDSLRERRGKSVLDLT